MKSNHLKLLSVCLLAVAGLLVHRKSTLPDPFPATRQQTRPEAKQQQHSFSRDDSRETPRSINVGSARYASSDAPESRIVGVPRTGSAGSPDPLAPPNARQSPSSGSRRGRIHSPTNHHNSVAQAAAPVRAIRLAEDFQLPAVLMPSGKISEISTTQDPATAPDKSPVEKATRAIVDDFYRDLSALASEESAVISESSPVATPDGEETTVIEPDPETNAVRRHSDELYRTLFGDEAYGRQSIKSALEVMVPVSTSGTP